MCLGTKALCNLSTVPCTLWSACLLCRGVFFLKMKGTLLSVPLVSVVFNLLAILLIIKNGHFSSIFKNEKLNNVVNAQHFCRWKWRKLELLFDDINYNNSLSLNALGNVVEYDVIVNYFLGHLTFQDFLFRSSNSQK